LQNARDLVYVERRTTIHKSFEIISHERVLSAPVWDMQERKWIGMVDVRDYLQYVLGKYGPQRSQEDSAATVDHIMNLSKRDPLVPVPAKANLISVLRMFDGGLHRVLVTNSIDNKEDACMLSQLDVISWISANKGNLGDSGEKTLEELGMIKKPLTVLHSETTINAFRLLHDHNIHGMAIVDGNQKIWGNISVTDLKYAHDNLDKLSSPLEKFLNVQNPLICSPQTKLLEVINKLKAQNVHRIHVVDSASVPVGVVTPSDIMDILLVLSQAHEGLID